MKNLNILLIEDNAGDILLIREAFEESPIRHELRGIRDGSAAIAFFDDCSGPDVPDLVLLDINLPLKSGHEVLSYIKKCDKLACMAVVMLTTSSSECDILSAYKYYADGYLVKPIIIPEFAMLLDKLTLHPRRIC